MKTYEARWPEDAFHCKYLDEAEYAALSDEEKERVDKNTANFVGLLEKAWS